MTALRTRMGPRLLRRPLSIPSRFISGKTEREGRLWVPTYDPTGLTLLADDYLRIAGNNAVDNGQRTFEFKAVRPGTHRVLFEKRMGWKFTAEDRRVFDVTASDSSSRRSA